MESLFWITNLTTLPFWFLMIWLPNWHWTKRIVSTPVVVLPVALLYIATTLPIFDTLLAAFLNPSLANLSGALGNPANALATWQHLLAFDLVAGWWAYHDGYGRQINRWLMTVTLTLTYLFGPLGFALYLALRTYSKNNSTT